MSTTTNYYVGAGDGEVNAVNSSWSTVRGATSGTASPTNGSDYLISYYWNSNYYIYRAFFPADTSGIPDAATISSASLCVCSAEATYAGSSMYAAVVATSQASTSTLEAADFDNVGSTRFSDDVEMAVNYNAYKSIALNATGLAAISKTGVTKIGLRGKKDLDNTTPDGTTGTNKSWNFYCSENTGTSQDPYVSVTYETGLANVKTVNGLAKASVKTVNGLAIASVKSINGLA